MIVGVASFFMSAMILFAIAAYTIHTSHTDHRNLHSNGFNRIVDGFVSKDHFDDVMEQLNERIRELEDRLNERRIQ